MEKTNSTDLTHDPFFPYLCSCCFWFVEKQKYNIWVKSQESNPLLIFLVGQ
jgi:hypothetical protein